MLGRLAESEASNFSGKTASGENGDNPEEKGFD